MRFQPLPPALVADWAERMCAAGKQPVVLDVREEWEQQLAHVQQQSASQGFQLLSAPLSAFVDMLDDLPAPDQPLACLCHHGVRSQHAAYFLSQRGFTDLYDISGGIDAWAGIDRSIARY